MTVIIDGTLGVDTIQANTVTSAKIVDGTIAPADLTGAQTGSAPIYGCRAWCVFDGTLTGTNAPTAGGNVANITRNGTGDYTVTFTTAMQDANYSINATSRTNATYASLVISVANGTAPTTSSFRISSNVPGVGNSDATAVYISIFR